MSLKHYIKSEAVFEDGDLWYYSPSGYRQRVSTHAAKNKNRMFVNGKYIPSILAAIGGVLETHMVKIGFLEGEGLGLKEDPKSNQVINFSENKAKACSSCGQYEMQMDEGCMTCRS